MEYKNESILTEKSFKFAVKIVETCKNLTSQNEHVLSRQLLRSGTSIGANCEEAQAAQSRKDFVAKLSIAAKEARETRYWLRLLSESNYLSVDNTIGNECEELLKILSKILITTKSTMK
jgi:four helix bundle protein